MAVAVSSDGTVSATVPANGASDAAGNLNTASTSTDNTVDYDTAAPTTSSLSVVPTALRLVGAIA